MTRPAVLRRLVPLVATATVVAGLAAVSAPAAHASGGAPAGTVRAQHHTAQQLGAFLRADRTRAASMLQQARSSHAPANLPAFNRANVPSVISRPTLIFAQVAFVSPTDIRETIVAKDLQTGVLTALLPASTTSCPYEPRLSPDGTMVAYLDFGSGCLAQSGTLNVLTLSGGTTSTLVTSPAFGDIQLPNWSPDSSKILYTQAQYTSNGTFVSSALLTVLPTGGSSTPITGGGLTGYDGVYSPDGLKIAYAPMSPLSATYLAVMNADGTSVSNLTQTASLSIFSPIHPAWSPDGHLLVFQYFKGTIGTSDTNGIGIAHVDDSVAAGGLGVTGGNNDSFFPCWAPDGTEIYYDSVSLDSQGNLLTNSRLYGTDIVGHRRATIQADSAHAYTSPSFAGPGLDTGSASTFTPVTPTRLLPRTPLGPGGVQDIQVTGVASIPAGATAVTLNVTGVNPSVPTYLQAYPTPGDGSFPLVSNLNLRPHQVSAVAVQVALSAGGQVRIRNNVGTTGVIVDVSGYFSAGTTANAYSPIAPTRELDTTLGAGAFTDVDLTTLAGTVTGLTPVAAVLNLTGSHPTTATYLTAYPTPDSGNAVPGVSNLNLNAGEARANLVTVPLSSTDKVRIYNNVGSVRAIADVVGFYGTGATGALAYYPLPPTRFLDTRNGTDTYLGRTTPLAANTSVALQPRGTATTGSGMITIPASAQAYVYNLTAVAPSAATYLTAYPFLTGVPTASTVNAPAGAVVPNLAITGADSNGQIGVFNKVGNTPFIVDLAGYYAPVGP
jgi:Tol biopolymer transport system component